MDTRKAIFFILIFSFIFLNFSSVFASSEKKEIDFFFSPTCPHCAREKAFLEDMEEKYPALEIRKFDVNLSSTITSLKKFYSDYSVPEQEQGFVPATFMGELYFVGFDKAVENSIKSYIEKGIDNSSQNSENEGSENKFSLPFFGQVELFGFSPLALAAILGGLDGFNACAMLALGFLLAVLIGSGLRRRVVLIGGTFIFVSGLVYFLFISAWLNLFMVLSHLKLITVLVGVVVSLFAVFLLRDYFIGVVCKLCHIDPKKQGISGRFSAKLLMKMQNLLNSDMSLPLVLLGVAGVAAGVNMVELVCSFGFPLAFTKILTGLQLSTVSYYFYLFVYIVFYMLDDFLIFLIAVLTLRITGVSQKYLRFIALISGIFLLLLGLIMIFKPEILSFAG